MMLIADCPTCGTKLEDNNSSPPTFRCNNCGSLWTLEDLEFIPVQNKIDEWI